MVKVIVVVPFKTMADGVKDLLMDGGAMIVMVFEPVLLPSLI